MNMTRRAGLVPILLPLLLAAAGIAAAEPYAIGHRTIVFVDPERADRQIPTEVYYPAETPGESVPIAAGPFPVLSFGHGYVMTVGSYEFLYNGLVPRGRIVALPTTEGGFFPSHEQLGLDLAFVLSALRAEGEDPASPFYGEVAPTSAVMGHSMGGGASVLAARADPTITVLANFAAAETNPSAIEAAADVSQPALIFAGSLDCVTPPAQHQIPIYEALASPCRALITVTGASHCQFADYNYLCSLGEGGCDSPTISRSEQHAIVLRLLDPWLRAQLDGDGEAWAEYQALLEQEEGFVAVQDCEVAQAPAEERSAYPPPLSLRVEPNPSRGAVDLLFDLPEPVSVCLEIHDAAGRLAAVPLDRRLGAGANRVRFSGEGADGRPLPAGIYFARLRAGEASASVRIVRLP